MAVAVSSAPVPGGCSLGDPVSRDRLPRLWRTIETAHYAYLQLDDSPDKLSHRRKLEGHIMEYLSLVPHEYKFGLSETATVFARSVAELEGFSAYRAGAGWAAIARYAANLLAQPWRKQYRTIRLYSGYYKHEVESNLVSAELLLEAMGYRADGVATMSLDGPACPDAVVAVSRDALVAYVECQMMCSIFERALRSRGGVTWTQVARERARRAGDVAACVARLARSDYSLGSDIYSNIQPSRPDIYELDSVEPRLHSCSRQLPLSPVETHPVPESCFQTLTYLPTVPYASPRFELPVMNYGVVPGYYYPVQGPYVMPAVYTKSNGHVAPSNGHLAPSNGHAAPDGHSAHHRHPVPTAQLIDLAHSPAYSSDAVDGKFDYGQERHRDDREKRRSNERLSEARRSAKRSNELPRSDTQPTLRSAREDGLGTYESWDYVFRNLSQKDEDQRYRRGSPPLERDSRTLGRTEREERRRFQPTTLDLEDGLSALSVDRSYDEEIYRTSMVNENLARLKQESELKRAKAAAKKQLAEERDRRQAEERRHVEDRDREARRHAEERDRRHTMDESRRQVEDRRDKIRPIVEPLIDIDTINPKVAPDKVRLISKKDAKDRKEIIKHCSNGRPDVKLKKPTKSLSPESERHRVKSSTENGLPTAVYGNRVSSNASHPDKDSSGSRELTSQLVVSLHEADGPNERAVGIERWECATCTYINPPQATVCEMCGKSRRAGSETAPLTSGGRECPACTLVNPRHARACDACGTSLQHSSTYI